MPFSRIVITIFLWFRHDLKFLNLSSKAKNFMSNHRYLDWCAKKQLLISQKVGFKEKAPRRSRFVAYVPLGAVDNNDVEVYLNTICTRRHRLVHFQKTWATIGNIVVLSARKGLPRNPYKACWILYSLKISPPNGIRNQH